MGRRRLPIYALLLANAISLAGEALTAIAIPWYVFETTGSAAKMGVVGFFTFLPRVLATFFGGALVDRVGFKPVSMLADTLSGLSVMMIPILHLTVGLSFEVLIALVFLGAAFDGPGSTARESMVPELAKMAELPLERVNSLYQMVQRLAIMVGPALAGVLIATMGASNVLLIDAATFALSLLVIGLLVPMLAKAPAPASQKGYWHDLADGLRFIRADRVLFWLAVILAISNFLEAPFATVGMTVLVGERYGGAEELGLLFSAFGAGAVVSTLVFASIGHRLPRYRTFATSFAAITVAYLVFAIAPPFPWMLVTMCGMGLLGGPTNTILMTVRQERVPEAVRARVFGTFTALAWVSIPLGQLAGGAAVEWWGPRVTFAITGVSFFMLVIAIWLNRTLREMNKGPSPEVLSRASA